MAEKEKNKVKVKANKGKAKKVAASNIGNARVFVTTTFNNTLITLTDTKGNALAWSSSGAVGFKGARRATPFAAISAMETVAKKAKDMGVTNCEVYIKGPGPGRDASVRALKNAGLAITMIADITPIPHNGPRPKKRRRV